MTISIEDQIRDLEQACQRLTATQITLDSTYGPAGCKLMNARNYLEKTYLHPLIKELLSDPDAAVQQ